MRPRATTSVRSVGTNHEPQDGELDPEEFIRRMLAISPEDAAEVREDAKSRVEVELVDGSDVVVSRWVQPHWHEPDDEYEVDGATYRVKSYTGPHTKENGRALYRVVSERA